MISLKEILKGADFNKQPEEVKSNLLELLEKINKVRTAYGKSMIITSGLRTMEDHLRIYKEKGITDTKKIPMASRHLIGAAVDIADSKKELQKWCLENVKLLEEIGLWMEHFDHTPTWTHFQIKSPRSGARFFKP